MLAFIADGAFESYRVTVNGVDLNNNEDPYDYIYQNLPDRQHVLRKVPNCLYCGAMRFQYESPGFCCRKGKIKVHVPQVPDELKRLFTSQVYNDAQYFRQNIRYFNSHFSFTSLGVTLDRQVATAAGTGIYTFRVHGALYHRLDHLVPGSKGARHLQLYFYDTENDSLAHRKKRSPDLDINLIRTVLRIMEGNPYVQTFNRVGVIPNLDDYVIELNTNVTPDQRRYACSGICLCITRYYYSTTNKFDLFVLLNICSFAENKVQCTHGVTGRSYLVRWQRSPKMF